MNWQVMSREDLLVKIKMIEAENSLLRKKQSVFDIEKGKLLSEIDRLEYEKRQIKCNVNVDMLVKYRDKIKDLKYELTSIMRYNEEKKRNKKNKN